MEPIFTPAELAEVHAYVEPMYAWAYVKDALYIAFSLVVLRFLVRPVHAWSERTAGALGERLAFARRVPVLRVLPAALDRMWNGSGWGTAILFAVAQLVLAALVFSLPRDIYFELHKHAHGLSNYTVGSFAYDSVKALVLESLALSLAVFGLYGIARRLRSWWWVLGVVAGIGMLAAPLIDPFRTQIWFDREPLAEGHLRTEISALMSRAEIEFSDVVVEKTSRVSKELQAYFAGQGPTRTIVMNDVLVEKLAQDEVLAAVAHEAGHVNERRWPRLVLSSFGLLAFLLLVHRLMLVSARRGWFGAREYGDVRTLPLLQFTLYAVMLVTTPLSLAWSRGNERAADQYALELTRDPAAFERMLVKAARLNKFDPDPPAFIRLKSQGHPTIRERIEHARAFQAQSASGTGRSPSPSP